MTCPNNELRVTRAVYGRSNRGSIVSFLRHGVVCITFLGFVAGSEALAQISSINSAIIRPRVFNDIPGATGSYVNNYPGSISLSESGVSQSTGFADRDVWYFSNDGGASPYQFQSGDYFSASFTITLTGNNPNNKDLEAGWLFSNPGGTFGGDCQVIVTSSGVVAQFGGPSYYPFSPAAGGYPGAGGSVANYTLGSTYTMGFIYTIDPNTGNPAFQYSVNGQYAASSPGNTYFDLAPGAFVGSPGDSLGGYLQIGNDPNNPSQSGTAVFGNISITSVPEPSMLALLSVGIASLLLRRRA